jgi:uncharacterized protein
MDKTELRELMGNLELRENEDGTKTLSGYAVKWEKKSHVLGYYYKFREQFQKGAFADSLKNDDQRFLWSHDTSKVLGRTKNNTLRLMEDGIGLRFEIDLPDTTLGDDTYKSIKRGDVDGVSFGFKAEDDDVVAPEDDLPIRTVKKAKLVEVSAVAFPAYPDSEVSARGYDPMKQHADELEERQAELMSKIYILNNL